MNLDMIRQLVLEENPMAKKDNIKVQDGANPKIRCFLQSTLTRNVNFKVPISGIEYRVFDFGKQRYSDDFVKNCEAISKFIALNYKHGGTEMDMAIKNMDKPTINVIKVP